MNGRIKFQVWSETQQRWRTAYCKPELLTHNAGLFRIYNFRVRP